MLAAALLVQVAVSASAQQVVGITNQNWQYFATTGGDPGVGWQNVGFVDTAWLTGRGLFGNDTGYPYPFPSFFQGPGNAATPGPNVAFFRTTFNWAGSTAGVIFRMTNYFDDGVVIYLNGSELTRFNMPAGAADQTTLALGTLTEPVSRIHVLALGTLTNGNANPLVAGPNVLAASVHNNAAGSSDTVFGLSILAQQAVAPCPGSVQPTNRTIFVGRSTTFTVLETCAVPAATIQWYRNVGFGEEEIVGATAAAYTKTNAIVGDAGDYYAKLTNPTATVESLHAVLTVNSDVTAPVFVSARLGNGATTRDIVVVTLNEAICADDTGLICPSDARSSFNWDIFDTDNGSGLTIGGITVNGSVITFTLDPITPWTAGQRYTVVMTGGDGGIHDIFGNKMADGTEIIAPVAPTAISVGPTGSATYDFASPPESFEFATGPYAGGANGATDTIDAMTAKILLLDRANFALALTGVAGLPPAAGGSVRHATDGGYLITRPTTTEGDILIAHLRNDSGLARPAISIIYDLANEIPGVEESPGHLVFYSATGTAGSWVAAPTDGLPGAKTNTLDFNASPWAVGAELYVLFFDDNGSPGPDSANEIDNFVVKFPASGIQPSIVSSPVSVSTNEGAVVRFTVVAAGSPPLAYQWFKGAVAVTDGGTISGATAATLTITGVVPADAGSYTCRVSNGNLPNATSGAATLTVSIDQVRPVLTRATSPNNTTIVLTFSKTMGAGAGSPAPYTLTGATVSGASLSNNVVTLTTSARAVGNSTLTILGVTDNRSTPNFLNPNPTVVSITTALVVDAYGSTWQFNTNSQDAAPTWKNSASGGVDWQTGPGLFGTETSAGTITLLAPLGGINTVIPPPNTNNAYLTTYFRKSVTLPALAVGTSYAISHVTDDGAVFYLNGAEIGRVNMPAGAVAYATLATVASTEGVVAVLPIAATAGAHTIAVEVHQSANNSSDIVFGAQVIVVPNASPALTISQNSTNALVNWNSDSNWQLVGSTNVAGPYAPVAGNPFRSYSTPKTTPVREFYKLNYVPAQ